MRLAEATKPVSNKRPGVSGVNTDKLDSMLGQLENEHTNLLGLAKAHKDALTSASVDQLNSITLKTSEVLMRIAQIEDGRREMITKETGTLASLDQLMEQFDARDRDRIGQRQHRLRDLISRVKEEQDAVRVASDNLAGHMRGLMQQVGASLSHTGTYSRGGAVAPGRSQVVSSLDMVQ